MLNLMLESVVVWDDDAAIVTVSPGLRTGWNVGDTQTIVGVAIPSIFSNSSNSVGVFGYFSYELPFTH